MKNETLNCRKCGGQGKPSKGIMNFHNIQFPHDGSKAEFETKLLNCIKCKDCGHSWVPEKSTTELALEWVKTLDIDEQIDLCIKYNDICKLHGRLMSNLTGREIEEIYKSEHKLK